MRRRGRRVGRSPCMRPFFFFRPSLSARSRRPFFFSNLPFFLGDPFGGAAISLACLVKKKRGRKKTRDPCGTSLSADKVPFFVLHPFVERKSKERKKTKTRYPSKKADRLPHWRHQRKKEKGKGMALQWRHPPLGDKKKRWRANAPRERVKKDEVKRRIRAPPATIPPPCT